ncbi:MAG TPA: hypothetical protein VK892_19030 [Pyrinomonadaceae bacterium]|nr:hypothetical protein [Pyrinomonadaceae bacterium]
MKRLINEIVFGKNTKASGLFALAIIALIALGCTCGGGSGTVPPEYVGAWTGDDGSTLTIRSDASGDFKKGGKEVTNGSVEVKDGQLSITFIGIGETLKIDEPPKGNQMKLNGVTYRKQGGSTVADKTDSDNKDRFSDDKNSSEKTDSGEMPSDTEIKSLVKETTRDFADAIEAEDFSSFMATTSSAFQKEFSADQMEKVFTTFIDKKDVVVPILRDAGEPKFSPPPNIQTKLGKKVLVADGTMPSGRYTVNFEYEYAQDGGDWKLQKIQVKM